MKRSRSIIIPGLVCLWVGVVSGNAGCNVDVAGELAAASGSYLGEVVTVIATNSLQQAWGVGGDSAEEEESDEHSHDEEALHDHEH